MAADAGASPHMEPALAGSLKPLPPPVHVLKNLLRQNRDLFSLNTEIFSWKIDLQFFRLRRIFSPTVNSLTNGARIYLT